MDSRFHGNDKDANTANERRTRPLTEKLTFYARLINADLSLDPLAGGFETDQPSFA